jgi:hypothetical protein
MKSGSLESELKSQLDRWSKEDLQLVQHYSERKTANAVPFQKRDPGVTVLTLDQKRVVEIVGDAEITDDPFFVKESPIDIWGAWRRVYYCNGWWVVGHYMMYSCGSEREADRVYSRLQADWDES